MSAAGSSKISEPLPGTEYAAPVPPIIDLSGKPKLPFTRKELDALSMPKVLISGGGIGGLTLALLLHKANIPFLVLERAKEIKPLGSAIVLGSTVSPLFIQLGIFDEFVKRGKVHHRVQMVNEDLTPEHNMEVEWLKEAVGYSEYVISRPDLYDILFNSIPRDRIRLGKRVLSFDQNENSVMVRCSDNSAYHGDILVGADGAYSAVRQNLYKMLKVDKKLPKSDDVALPFSCVCLVGQTIPLDPEEFPHMKEGHSQFHTVLGISTMCTAAEALARDVRVFKVPGGKDGRVRTLGEYVDKTPSHLLSKVMLEEIVFDTWYGGRTVLLGDACHKMSPAGGSGAITAIHDAVTLANWMSTLRLAGEKQVVKAFKEYKNERCPVAKDAFEASRVFIKSLGKTVVASLVREMMKRLPHWLWKKVCLKMAAARHQASFLPLIEEKSKVKPLYQRSLHRTIPILKDLADNPPILATERSAPVTV
ncbi:hypothetical protein BG000_009441 [Podila horticola]|nr:hypothetical protein BG000_009441 [Podila horticola]